MFFFFNDTATTEIYTLSLHDALPISNRGALLAGVAAALALLTRSVGVAVGAGRDRKSTRLNSSHGYISYAVFCLKKKKITVADVGRQARAAATARSSCLVYNKRCDGS